MTAAKRPNDFPVVGIGASAGGLEALEELFKNMPADTGMAFLVISHQHPGHTSLLPELLGKCTSMPTVEVTEGVRLEPNHVYVSPPGGHVALSDRKVRLMEGAPGEMPPHPIDFFFRSLAQDQKERAICIVLSGTGTDGTLGLKAIKGESGMAMVQEVQSARYAGMPSSAIATALVDYVLPPAAMPAQLVAYARGIAACRRTTETVEAATSLTPQMQTLFALLRERTGHDFSSYKQTTMHRRIERRMTVHQVKGPNEYVRLLQDNPHEIDILFKELLIGVTSFFRDPEAFAALAAKAIRSAHGFAAGQLHVPCLGARLRKRRGSLHGRHPASGVRPGDSANRSISRSSARTSTPRPLSTPAPAAIRPALRPTCPPNCSSAISSTRTTATGSARRPGRCSCLRRRT